MRRATSCIALHMDSLCWAAGDEQAAKLDPTWFRVLDRFLEMADRRGLRYTLFAIGCDLCRPEVASRVGELAKAGHEIGNHSFSHRLDLGAASREVISFEIREAHDLIRAITGSPPRGFAAPGWSRSELLLEELARLGYVYSASAFPSWLMAPMLLKLLWNFRSHPRLPELLGPKDPAICLRGEREPFVTEQGPVEIPVPTTRHLRLACWHTFSFVCPKPLFDLVLERCLESPWFMYVVHPADLLDPEDVPPALRGAASSFERLEVPLKAKRRRLEEVLDRIVERSRAVVTCEEMTRALLSRTTAPASPREAAPGGKESQGQRDQAGREGPSAQNS